MSSSGATAVPLALEVLWRSDGTPAPTSSPRSSTIEKGGQALAKGKDPYHEVTNPHGKVLYQVQGEPTYEGFLPYLPLMTVFGLPSARSHDIVLTDARIFFSLATLVVTAAALALCRSDGRRKMRTLQVIAILPTAALPAGHRGRRHAGRGLPAAGHGAGPAAAALRLRPGARRGLGHEVHRLAPGRAGPLRRPRPARAPGAPA